MDLSTPVPSPEPASQKNQVPPHPYYIPRCEICNDLEVLFFKPGMPWDRGLTLAKIRVGAEKQCLACLLVLQASLKFKDRWKEVDEENLTVDFQHVYSDDGSEDHVFVKYMVSQPGEFWIEIFAEITLEGKSDCPYPMIPTRNLISESPASQQCLRRLSTWIEACRNEHPLCNQPDHSHPPRRVIEVLSSDGDEILRLREPEGESFVYTALSHCWGQESAIKPLRTTKAKIELHKLSLRWEDLSQTFQDAITITRNLGIHYCWIDSLCIIQDDNQDWQEQASRMAGIYTNAELTIAAIGAPHGGVGFLSQSREIVRLQGSSLPNMSTRDVFYAQTFHGGHPLYAGKLGWHDGLPLQARYNPLYHRGWCIQERFLSTRMIQYGNSEMIWQCKTSLQCECATDTLSSLPSFGTRFEAARNSASPEDGMLLWRNVVELYTSTQLSNRSDVLPALSGLATIFQAFQWGKYIAGLWEGNLVENLSWYRIQTSEEDREVYTAPSFSWASSIGRVIWCSRVSYYEVNYGPMCELVGSYTETRSGMPMGEVTGGFLKLAGFPIPASINGIFDEEGYEASIDSYTHQKWIHMDHSNDLVFPYEGFFCFPVWGTLMEDSDKEMKVDFEALLLERLSTGCYRRIGFFTTRTLHVVQSMPYDEFCGVSRQEITIV